MKQPWNTLPTLVAVAVLTAINPVYAQTTDENETEVEVTAVSETASQTRTNAKNEDFELEVIEVSGLRSSLMRASEIKKHANSVIDVISAEDVGNFPDENVVESMQRITGVQVIFGENGGASSFQVRGVSENRIELNGRSVAGGEGSEPDRQVNLSDIPSELIDTLEVIKSPTAAKTEGSLGATINLKTKRPLQVKKDFLNVNAKAKYGDEADKLFPNLNLTGVKNWRDTSLGDFGALVNLTYNDNQKGGEVIRVSNWGEVCPVFRSNGNGYTTQDQSLCETEDSRRVFRPNNFTLIDQNAQNKKTAIAATFQWAPNDTSSYTVDFIQNKTLNHSTSDVLLIQSQTNTMVPDTVLGDETNIYALSNVSLGTELMRYDDFSRETTPVTPITAFDSSFGFLNRSTAQAGHNTTEQTTLALKGQWDLDNLTIEGEVAHSKSDVERHYIAFGYNAYTGTPDSAGDHRSLVQDPSLNGTDEAIAVRQEGSNLSIDLSDPRALYLNLSGGEDPTDLRIWRLNGSQDDGWTRSPTTSAAKLDFDYFVDYGALESVQFGARVAQDVMENTSRYRFTCGRNYSAGGYVEGESPACSEPMSAVELAEKYGDSINRVHDGFFSEYANIPSWVAFDLDMYRDNRELWNEISGFNEVGYVENAGESYTITEDTSAAYAMMNLNGDISSSLTYRGNFGVRAVKTKITAETYEAVDENNAPVATTRTNSYNTFLPSMNIAFAYEDLGLVRLAAARTMVRPALARLLPTAQLNRFSGCNVYDPENPYGIGILNKGTPNPDLTQEEQNLQLAQQYAIANDYNGSVNACPGIRGGSTAIGNIALDPQLSYNYDLSFEHYWGKGNMASLAFFYRKVQADLITRRVVFAVPTDPANELVGVESNLGGGETYLLGESVSQVPGFELWRARESHNGQGSIRQGIEIGYTQWLDSLPGAWSGLGFSLNYTYSEGTRPDPIFLDAVTEEEINLSSLQNLPVEYAGQTIPSNYSSQLEIIDELLALGDEGPLANGVILTDYRSLLPVPQLSKHSGNASIFYDKGRYNVRLSANYRSKYYSNSGLYSNAVYYDDTLRADFSSSYKVNQNLKIQFTINNILKTNAHRWRTDSQLTDTTTYSDRFYTFGVNYKFN
ncbi:TonB-dependent receptor [Paraglaciecola sp. L3A3]|uniref:TonB-dependent receptor n=1 Tax=Paraglaciecola sp. L3A3 TaxID=2686358 RepID=UPI00131C0744|nr:TonB-dependent receptor [Paraglaciecola sp. L3A3]